MNSCKSLYYSPEPRSDFYSKLNFNLSKLGYYNLTALDAVLRNYETSDMADIWYSPSFNPVFQLYLQQTTHIPLG